VKAACLLLGGHGTRRLWAEDELYQNIAAVEGCFRRLRKTFSRDAPRLLTAPVSLFSACMAWQIRWATVGLRAKRDGAARQATESVAAWADGVDDVDRLVDDMRLRKKAPVAISSPRPRVNASAARLLFAFWLPGGMWHA